MSLIRALYDSGAKSHWNFDVMGKARDILELLKAHVYPMQPDYEQLNATIEKVDACVKSDRDEPRLCHNDFYAPNFLVSGDDIYLIDWEYSAMLDYASDLGTFICCSDCTYEEARQVFDAYFGRKATPEELRHCLAYVALASYYWFVWALYKESSGDPVGEWLYLWHRYTKQYSALALERYGKA